MGKLYLNKDVLKEKTSKYTFPQTRRFGLCFKGEGALPIPERPAGLHIAGGLSGRFLLSFLRVWRARACMREGLEFREGTEYKSQVFALLNSGCIQSTKRSITWVSWSFWGLEHESAPPSENSFSGRTKPPANLVMEGREWPHPALQWCFKSLNAESLGHQGGNFPLTPNCLWAPLSTVSLFPESKLCCLWLWGDHFKGILRSYPVKCRTRMRPGADGLSWSTGSDHFLDAYKWPF